MAGFGGGDDVQIKVTLDTATAEEQARKLKAEIEKALSAAAGSVGGGGGAGGNAQVLAVLKEMSVGIKGVEAQMKAFGAATVAALDTARKAATDLATGFATGMKEALAEATKLDKELQQVGKDAEQTGKQTATIGKNLADTSVQTKKLKAESEGLLSVYGGIKAAVAAIGTSVLARGFGNLIAAGDDFRNISEAFDESATKAGLLADTLKGNLRAAVNGTVSDFDLLTAANKAFAFGIDPAVFDDLAAAADRAADKFGGDTTKSLNQLIIALETGNEKSLKLFGTLKDGSLVIDKFSKSTSESGIKANNLHDIFEQLSASLANTYDRIGAALNNSKLLQDVFGTMARIVTGAANAFVYIIEKVVALTNKLIELRDAIDEAVFKRFAVLGELAKQSATGTFDYAKAVDAVNKSYQKAKGPAEANEKLVVRTRKANEEAAKAVKKHADELKKFAETAANAKARSDAGLNDLLGIDTFVLPDANSLGGVKSVADSVFEAFRDSGDDLEVSSRLTKLRDQVIGGLKPTDEQSTKYLEELYAGFDKAAQKGQDKFKAFTDEQIKKEAEDNAGLFSDDFRTFLGKYLSENQIDNLEIGAIFGDQLLSGLGSALADGKINAQDTQAIGATIGGAIGTAVGLYFSGGSPAGAAAGAGIGSVFGGFISQFTAQFSDKTAGSKARREADHFFADVFDADRLSVIIGGQVQRIRDLVFNPTAGGSLFQNFVDTSATFHSPGNGLPGQNPGENVHNTRTDADPNDPFANGTFDDALAAQQAKIQAGFNAVGAAFEQLLGVADDISGQIGAVLFNNVGGSLENLQVLVQTTGKTFEDLGNAIFEAFFNGNLSIEEAYQGLVNLQDIFTVGIPGALGDVEGALENFQAAFEDGKGSRILIDSIRDIGAEARELGQNDLSVLVSGIGNLFGFTTEQMAFLSDALRQNGLNNLEDLVNASNAALLTILENVRRAKENINTVATTAADPNSGSTPPTNFTAGSSAQPKSSGGGGVSSGPSAADKAAEDAKREREARVKDAIRLLDASAAYEKIVDAIARHELDRAKAGREIQKLFGDILRINTKIADKEEEYQKLLDEGERKNRGRLGALAGQIDDLQKKLDKLTQNNKEADESFHYDLTPILAMVKTANELGVVARQAGLSVENSTELLVEGFRRGTISITEFRQQLEGVEDNLGQGIPNAIGDVGGALANLIGAGRQGGEFSLDALQDIFAELKEGFEANLGPKRAADLKKLTTEFEAAKKGLDDLRASGADPRLLQAAQDRFTGAKKALDDFNASSKEGPSFDDLRAKLSESLSSDQVDIFFKALSENGINSIDAILDDTTGALSTKVLATLDKLGFKFADEVAPNLKAIIDNENAQVKAKNDGNDLIKTGIDLLKGFNQAAEGLPSTFTGISDSTKAINDTLEIVINKLGSLNGTTFRSKFILDVSTRSSGGLSDSLSDYIFDGTELSTGNTKGPGLTPSQRNRYETLRAKRKNGKLTPAERQEFRELVNARGAN